jgi:deoxyribodipyrimidine photo-lyase
MKTNIFWFRRDLRLEDNQGLDSALLSALPVLPVFIFDTNITGELQKDDPRISFIYERLGKINNELQKSGSSLLIKKGDPLTVWKELIVSFDINEVYLNKDYEPYATERDTAVESLLMKENIPLLMFKDQVIFEEREIIKTDNTPYTIFTPYKNKWIQKFTEERLLTFVKKNNPGRNFYKSDFKLPDLDDIGFAQSTEKVSPYDLTVIKDYDKYRDLSFDDKTSYLSPHLRFGTVSIRKIVRLAADENPVFLNELIWREFFLQILFNYPHVVTENFKRKYDNIQWRNNEEEFGRWCRGETGYPIVDAGMRQLNETGYMHNRVRMITAGFLCKHLLIDWRWGEAYFAAKLLDYELSSNNGNWQWAAGTGCDAAPYFRIFNPHSQQKRFDADMKYVRKWVPGLDSLSYSKPIVDHDFARTRAINTYKNGLKTL